MENNTLIIGQFWAWYMAIFTLMLLLIPKSRSRFIETIKSDKVKFILGFIAFMMGLVNIIIHNHWNTVQESIVSFFGWSAMIKGIILLFFPQFYNSLFDKFLDKYISIFLIFIFMLACYMLWLFN